MNLNHLLLQSMKTSGLNSTLTSQHNIIVSIQL